MSRIRERLAREEGFTLIELLVVIVIIGILLAIVVPSYLGFRDRASNSAASSNIRAAVPSAEAYYADHNSYTDMLVTDPLPSTKGLKENYDSGLKSAGTTKVNLGVATDGKSYCVSAIGKDVYFFSGPGGEVTKVTTATPKPALCPAP